VERTFAWLGLSRRFSKDYERLPETAEAMIYGAMSRLSCCADWHEQREPFCPNDAPVSRLPNSL
jgi:hypothetical protein